MPDLFYPRLVRLYRKTQENRAKKQTYAKLTMFCPGLAGFSRKILSNRTKRENCAKSTCFPGLVGFFKEIPIKQGKMEKCANRPCFTQVLAIFGLKNPYKTGEKTRKCQIDPIFTPPQPPPLWLLGMS